MGKHSSANSHPAVAPISAPTRSRKRVAAQIVGVLVVLGLLAWSLTTVRGQAERKTTAAAAAAAAAADRCANPLSLRVMTASSFKSVLDDLAPHLQRSTACIQLDVQVVDGRPALKHLPTAAPDVWIPDDGAWAMNTGEDVLAPEGQLSSRSVVATSPIYQVTDPTTAAGIKAAGGSWLALSGLLAKHSGVRLTAQNPDKSGDGLIALGSLGESVWLARGMHSQTVASVASAEVTRLQAGSAPALPTSSGEVGLVPEYALLPELDSGAADLEVLTGVDHTAMLRFTWLPLTAAVADPARNRGLQRLLAALKGKPGQKAIDRAGLRWAAGEPPSGVAPGRLPALNAPPFDPIGPHRVDHVFAAWHPEERRANLLFVVDVSGSMRERARGTKTPLIRLVARGVESVITLLPESSRLGLWEFGSRLRPPNDHRVLVRQAALSDAQRAALSRSVRRLKARSTGTGLYDTILAAYRSAVASYQPGVPNQVLVFTDAVNEDDPGGIALRRLSKALRKSADPSRPVSLAVAAFGSRSDKGLGKVLEGVKGSLVRVTDPQEVGAVFVHAAVGGLR